MSSGGHHQSSFWKSRKVNVTRGGSFLLRTTLPTTDKSQDPLLVSKPVSRKEEHKSHETDRIVHTSLLQSGKGEENSETSLEKNEDLDSDSGSDSSSSDNFDTISEVKTIHQAIKRKNQSLEPKSTVSPPNKKYKPCRGLTL